MTEPRSEATTEASSMASPRQEGGGPDPATCSRVVSHQPSQQSSMSDRLGCKIPSRATPPCTDASRLYDRSSASCTYDRCTVCDVATKSERLNLRLTTAQDTVLRRAAEAHGEAVSEYVLRHAVEAAQADLADRRLFVVDERAWRELEQLLDRPPRPAAKLRRLLEERSPLDRA